MSMSSETSCGISRRNLVPAVAMSVAAPTSASTVACPDPFPIWTGSGITLDGELVVDFTRGGTGGTHVSWPGGDWTDPIVEAAIRADIDGQDPFMFTSASQLALNNALSADVLDFNAIPGVTKLESGFLTIDAFSVSFPAGATRFVTDPPEPNPLPTTGWPHGAYFDQLAAGAGTFPTGISIPVTLVEDTFGNLVLTGWESAWKEHLAGLFVWHIIVTIFNHWNSAFQTNAALADYMDSVRGFPPTYDILNEFSTVDGTATIWNGTLSVESATFTGEYGCGDDVATMAATFTA